MNAPSPRIAWAVTAFTVSFASAAIALESVPFDSPRWNLEGARVVDHLGRAAVAGTALLSDVDFHDGVIEVDIAVDGRTSYPGVLFRMQSNADYENFYLRPHRGPLSYGDALQYTPVFHGISGWQLYNGDGSTANGEIPRDEWVPLRVEVKGAQAKFYWNGAEEPSLVVTDLKHGDSRGFLGISGPANGTAYFSNFRYDTEAALAFDPPPPVDHPAGMITGWELSRTFRVTEIDAEKHPSALGLGDMEWERVRSDASGLVDVARYRARSGPEPDAVYARTTLRAEGPETRIIDFGYSDLVTIYLNGTPLFTGASAYRQRDPSFAGIVGLFDQVYLPLRKGDNELMFLVVEAFGGWGFEARDVKAVDYAAGVRPAWETPKRLRSAESVVYDAEHRRFYVSNYDVYVPGAAAGTQTISTVSLDGRIEDAAWADGLAKPTGMAIDGGDLLVVERSGVARVDRATGEVTGRTPLPGALFPNDIAVGDDGVFYVSDSAGKKVWRVEGDAAGEWLGEADVTGPNALCILGSELLVGDGGVLKAFDLTTKKVRVAARLGAGNIDGIKPDGRGGLLVSHYEGRLFRVAPDGSFVKLLDTTAPGRFSADFDYVPEQGLVVIPTFYDNRVAAYRIDAG